MSANRLLTLMKLVFITLFISIILVLSAQPVEIRTAVDLDNIRLDLNEDYIQMDNIVLTGPWTPINGFTGSYNGNGYSISDLSIWEPQGTYTGLFGYLSGGELRKIRLINPNVFGHQYFAALVGYNDNGLIEGCAVYNGVSVGVVDPYDPLFPPMYYGGLVGYNDGMIKSSYVKSTDIMMSAIINDITETIGIYIGGLTGFNASNGIIEDCFVLNGSVSGDDYVAGLVGHNEGDVVSCYAAIPVNSQNNSGGLIAYSDYLANCENSYWNTAVSGLGHSDGGEGRTTIQLIYPYDEYTYVGWDFDDIDFIWSDDYSHTINSGYPFLLPPYNWESISFAGGNGSEINPYQISNAYQMNRVREHLDAHFIIIDDFNLNVPPWNTDEGWVPIGDLNNRFIGSLNGDGCTIYNLFINRPNGNEQGLFGHIGDEGSPSSISNLKVIDVKITGQDVVGILAGQASWSSVENVHVQGIIQARAIVGGLIGITHRCYPVGIYGIKKINKCSSDIIIDNLNVVGYQIGGLIGSNEGSLISYCYATGSVKTTMSSSTGGLVGLNTGINVNQRALYSEINKSYSAVSVTGNFWVGGLVGNNFRNNLAYAYIKKSYSTGAVTGNQDFGGLVGFDSGDVSDSYWDIESSGQTVSAGSNPLNNYIGLTTVKMMQQATFTNWNFSLINGTWAISEWYNEDPFPTYPYLQWQVAGQDPVGIAHNKPVNYEPEFGEGGRSLTATANNRWFWVSFPWISRNVDGFDPYPDRQTAEEVLRPLAADGREYIDYVQHWNMRDTDGLGPTMETMEWIQQGGWDDNIGTFCSTLGYKIRFSANGTYELPTYGTGVADNTQFEVFPDGGQYGNWVGYFITQPQDVSDAFGVFMDAIMWVRTQNGSIRWWPEFGTWETEGNLTLEYGQMCEVALRGNDPVNMTWNVPQGRSTSGRIAASKPKPEHFVFSDGPDYQSFFIKDIANDENVVEIGVYVDGQCVGASVFRDSYPVEILAYTNENHLNEPITFVLYLDDDSYERYETVLVGDWGDGAYSRQTLVPFEDKFTLIKLDRTGGERSLAVEEEEFIQPGLKLGQNYPNPFSIRTGLQGHDITNISFSLPQDLPVKLNIYNIRGQIVRSLVTGKVNKGDYTVGWDGKDSNNRIVASGIYFYKLETAEKTITRKMLIVR